MNNRSVANVLVGERINMGDTQVKQALPTNKVDQISPFLLLHHFGPQAAEPGQDPLDVGPHPHRGFDPVTFLFSGGILHRDSRDNEGVLQGGDVQWMSAGRGIIHSERASADFLAQGGTMEGIQLWVNVPASQKMAQPSYQDIKAADMPAITEDEGRVQWQLVAGEHAGHSGPARTHTPLLAMTGHLQAGGHTAIHIAPSFNALLYIVGGRIKLNGNWDYPDGHLLHFRQDGDGITIEALEDSRVLLLAGEPIDEPVASYGPFVMNTQSEIMEAMRDYQMGKMGVYVGA